MPNENESRPCLHLGCTGTQTYRLNAAPVLWHTKNSGKERQDAWVCDKNREHFDLAMPNSMEETRK